METLHLVAQYKEQNIPLLEIKEKVELFHTNRIEQEKVLKYTQNLSKRMEYLETELKEMKPILESLSAEQQKSVRNNMSTQGMALAKLITVLFN